MLLDCRRTLSANEAMNRKYKFRGRVLTLLEKQSIH
jgi:hypothetical protein